MTSEMLDYAITFLRRYVVLSSDHQATALGLFVAHTHTLEAAVCTPYLNVLAPEKACGKTRLLEVLEVMCARPWRVVSPSEAVMFRKIERDRPTLLLDEIDALFKGASERTEPLRALLNAGNRAGAVIPRCVGKDQQLQDFGVFCPKVLGGIDNGTLPDTIRDRSIPIRMRRKRPDETVERFLLRDIERDALELHDWFESWAEQNTEALANARPDLPSQLDDRAAEAWEPLFAIADMAGSEWAKRAREAALELSTGLADDSESRGVVLLRDLQGVYDQRGVEAMATTDLLEALTALEESPWGGWHHGGGLRARDLSRLLKPYLIRSRTVRVETGPAKGFKREQFEDAWARYLPLENRLHRTQRLQPAPHVARDVTDVTDVTVTSGSTMEAA